MKPLIVGESNPYGGGDEYALYPSPDGCSGHRLCTLILGMGRKEYLEKFDRTNLVSGKWSIRRARARAAMLYDQRYCILLGQKVCSAFDVPFIPGDKGFPSTGGGWLVLPHPSGLNRMWNEVGMIERCRRAVEDYLEEIKENL